MPLDKDRPLDKSELHAQPGSFEWYVVQKLDQLDHGMDRLQTDVGQLQNDVRRLENTVGRLENAVNGTDNQDGILTRLSVIEQTMATKTWVLALAPVELIIFTGMVVAMIKIW
ncbi:MAG: hypothetical protein F4Z81_00935 [Gemmatimonadetes bacterium]|nr:hypothetical protein [Gemmatimonadota bacterium]MYB62302.1 hypothetical protein [Gemmatimonadota bacterium]